MGYLILLFLWRQVMAKAKKAKAEKKSSGSSLKNETAKKCEKKSGLYNSIVNHYELPQEAGYARTQTNKGMRAEAHPDAVFLDIKECGQALNISEYDSNIKHRSEAISFIKGKLGRNMRKGDVFAWAGRKGDSKSGNANRAAKYFYSASKSLVSKETCEALCYFAVTSAETAVEGD